MAISYSYRHVVVTNVNFTLLLTSSGPDWELHMSSWSFISYKKWKSSVKQEQNLKQAQIFRFTQVKLMMDPPFENAWAQSELFTFQCDQWEPIQNSQLIGIYKDISFTQVKLMIYPQFESARPQSELFTFQCDQWEPFWNSQLIRKYKEIPVHIYLYRFQRQRPIPNLRWSTQIGCYWHQVIKNGNLTLLLTPSGQEWQLHIPTDI